MRNRTYGGVGGRPGKPGLLPDRPAGTDEYAAGIGNVILKWTESPSSAVPPKRLTLYSQGIGRDGTVRYRLPQRGLVRVRVYDMRGILIVNVLYGVQDAGDYEINLPKGKIGNGVYLLDFRS